MPHGELKDGMGDAQRLSNQYCSGTTSSQSLLLQCYLMSALFKSRAEEEIQYSSGVAVVVLPRIQDFIRVTDLLLVSAPSPGGIRPLGSPPHPPALLASATTT
ncbi:hypothetical protein HRR83_006892 [Exophiala dermatitidis]|uniref:Uncharacterized protein n=1 Tax=Exophiala dermatitidis TaxID=5970 RepID=A0AAN6ISG9_EXODE|nr:hypothetical protein HRR77_005752 [Exophiala dermatitidis]KAJ4548243.1 hypothetical protein HRR76_000850 [Exophiala dermatitidis]KAJ4578512.1 hypothetical protein HRR79_001812 [Exophiala dermatitidis]KAJ4579865.1 hypothetical protein HRR81_002028 [Exophiala dermatitidis]KAJ4592334.1 hypothetical protein HRR83_006892 [Exophiala dermatitidis]